jgi:hypothetical protein
VHNVYLLAGAWRIVRNVLRELKALGLGDTDVCGQLRASEKIRARYLVLYDVITMLARMGQQRVSNIAAATGRSLTLSSCVMDDIKPCLYPLYSPLCALLCA